MALTLDLLRDQAPTPDGPGLNPDLFYVRERLWLTADHERVVAEGHEDSAFLFATPGKTLPMSEAVKYGLAKTVSKPKDKAVRPGANK